MAEQKQNEKSKKTTTRVKVYITPKKGILDPQGKTVQNALHSLKFKNVENLRIGKYIELELAGKTGGAAEEEIDEMCEKLLAKPVIEDYFYEVVD
ncbi:MAG: phosphoribosylformylglycinamidine synthase subunit PurS [Candidatus Margulisbacteria bacterium]|nr:phosphoribosylformylglycinamidine synthase subunit PurS [Candidatus Margulisiibacteriota bacterium]